MNSRTFACLLGAIMVSGCVGTPPKAYIYSPEERAGGMGVPPAQIGATGEVRYCLQGPFDSQKTGQKRAALANIAEACGGEQSYFVIGEAVADVRFMTMGALETSCVRGAGRVIYFKCNGANSKAAGHRE